MGKSRSGPPLLNAHYNLLLPTVPHDNPPARPLRFSIGVKRSGDGLVRSVVVVARGKEYTRPISKLIMLIEGEELP